MTVQINNKAEKTLSADPEITEALQ